MEAQELRIGNLTNIGVVTSINQTDFIVDDKWGSCAVTIEPIPLTEEILLKCGMHKSIWSVTRFVFNDEQDQFHIDILNDRFVFRGLGMSIVYVDFLHDLQNLYFAVTRKELTISL